MKGFSKRTMSLVAVVPVLLGLWGYDTFDKRALEQTFKSVAKKRLAEVAARTPHKGTVNTSIETVAWRSPPVLGRPWAKAVVSVKIHTTSGLEFSQTYDYFFKREGAEWVEDHAGHAHGAATAKGQEPPCH